MKVGSLLSGCLSALGVLLVESAMPSSSILSPPWDVGLLSSSSWLDAVGELEAESQEPVLDAE